MMVRKQGDWLAAKVGDELVMMSAEKGNYIGLSEVGARIWELIETPQEVDAVCTQLEDEFEVAPEVCRAEVETFPQRAGETWRDCARSAAGRVAATLVVARHSTGRWAGMRPSPTETIDEHSLDPSPAA